MLITKENKQAYIESMARYYKKSVEQITKEVEAEPDRLEGWAEHLANDFVETKVFRKVGNKYYE